MPEQASIQTRNYSAVTNNDILQEVRNTHSHLQTIARLMDKASAPAPERSPIDEFAFIDEVVSDPANTTLNMQMNASAPCKIECILISIPATATATLAFSHTSMKTIPNIPAGLTVLTGIAIISYEQEIFTLTSTVSGALYMEFMGHVLTGNRWSKI